jgi:hypothetical protein
MFNLFRKKQDVQSRNHPISQLYSDLTTYQRMSVVNFLSAIACCEGGKPSNKEQKIIEEYFGYLNVDSDHCMEYLQSCGVDRTLLDVNTMRRNQKEFLVLASYELLLAGRSFSEIKTARTAELFECIGIDSLQYMYIVQKSQVMLRHFSR